MIKRKHLEHEHDENCHCYSDGHFAKMCEEDPELEEKARRMNEVIKKQMIRIKEDREGKGGEES
jgi:hypothetical protein